MTKAVVILAFFLFGKTSFGLNSYCIQYHIMATYLLSTNGSNAFDILLRLSPRKYKYNAYRIRKGLFYYVQTNITL
jgi:TM2 domain-containing membrane protein YozV